MQMLHVKFRLQHLKKLMKANADTSFLKTECGDANQVHPGARGGD